MLDSIPIKKYLDKKRKEGTLTPELIVEFLLEDTSWFMQGLTKKQHHDFVQIIKIENTSCLKR